MKTNLKYTLAIIAVALLILLIAAGIWFTIRNNKTMPETKEMFEVQKSIKYRTTPDITTGDLNYYINVLASDSLEGRAAGTAGEKKAIDFIREKISDYGLSCQVQPFTFIQNNKTWFDCSLSFGNFKGEMYRDFLPIRPIDSCNVSGEVVFVGYGYDYLENGKVYNDYKDVDVRDKWVMMFEGGYFEKIVPKSKQSLDKRYDIAQKKGAAGILTINLDSASDGQLVSGGFGYSYLSNHPIEFLKPFIRISGKTADSLFRYVGCNTSEALKNIKEKRWNIQIPVKVNGSVNTRNDSLSSNNIIAFWEGGDSILKKEYIVIGAHYDHLGMKTFPVVVGDTTLTYYGADDNASGTAGVMELAEKLVSSGKLKRSLIFVLFGAEESQPSLRGSSYFCENFPVPPDKIKLMINLDMIGRMDSMKDVFIKTDVPNSLLLKKAGVPYPDIALNIDTKNVGKSDHRPFADKKIPIAYFTTGTHEDYHTPKDIASSINYDGEKRLLDLIYDFIILKSNAE